jgi:hypothetical protein
VRSFVVQVRFGDGKTREYIRRAFAAYKLQQEIERAYPDAQVLEIYTL